MHAEVVESQHHVLAVSGGGRTRRRLFPDLGRQAGRGRLDGDRALAAAGAASWAVNVARKLPLAISKVTLPGVATVGRRSAPPPKSHS
jgi:hypothetical protein